MSDEALSSVDDTPQDVDPASPEDVEIILEPAATIPPESEISGETSGSPTEEVDQEDITNIVREYEGNLNLLDKMRGVDPAVLRALVELRQKNAASKLSQDEERYETLTDFLSASEMPTIQLLRRVKSILKSCPIHFLNFFLLPGEDASDKNGLERLGEILQSRYVNLLRFGDPSSSPASPRNRLTVRIGASFRSLIRTGGETGPDATSASGERDGVLELSEMDEAMLIEVVFLFKCCIRNERGFRGLLSDPSLLRKFIVLHSRLHLTRNVTARNEILQFLTMLSVVNREGHDAVLDALSDESLAVLKSRTQRNRSKAFSLRLGKKRRRGNDDDGEEKRRNPFADIIQALEKHHLLATKRGDVAVLSRKYILSIFTFINVILIRAAGEEKPSMVLQLLDSGLLPILSKLKQRKVFRRLPPNVQNHMGVLQQHIGDVSVHPQELSDQMLRRVKNQSHLSMICNVMSDLVNSTNDGFDRRLKHYNFLVESDFVNKTKNPEMSQLLLTDYTNKIMELQEQVGRYERRFEVIIRAIKLWSAESIMEMITSNSMDPDLCRVLSKMWAKMEALKSRVYNDDDIADEDIDAEFEREKEEEEEGEGGDDDDEEEGETSSSSSLTKRMSSTPSFVPPTDLLAPPDSSSLLLSPPDASSALLLPPDSGLLLPPPGIGDLLAPPDSGGLLLAPPGGGGLLAPPGGGLLAPPGGGGGMLAPPGGGGGGLLAPRRRRGPPGSDFEIAKMFERTKSARRETLSRFMNMSALNARKVTGSIFMKSGLAQQSHSHYSDELQTRLIEFVGVRKKRKTAEERAAERAAADEEAAKLAAQAKRSILAGNEARSVEISLRTLRMENAELRENLISFNEEIFTPPVVQKVHRILETPTSDQFAEMVSLSPSELERCDICSQWFHCLGSIPFLKLKMECWNWRNEFTDFTKNLQPTLDEFMHCSTTLVESSDFHSFLQYVLVVSNILSKNKPIIGFRLKSLEKLLMLKSQGRTLLDFLVEYVKEQEHAAHVLSWPKHFANVKAIIGLNYDAIKDDIGTVGRNSKKLENLFQRIEARRQETGEDESPYEANMRPALENMLRVHGELEELYARVENQWGVMAQLFGEDVDYIKVGFFKDIETFITGLQAAKKAYLIRKRREEKKRRRIQAVQRVEAEEAAAEEVDSSSPAAAPEEKIIDIVSLQDLLNTGAIFQQQGGALV